MSLTITPQISGQQANSTLSYSFLQEPLKVHITDSDADTRIIYADVTKINTDDGVVVSTDVSYVYRDVSSNGSIVIDLSKVMNQMHDYNTIKFGSITDISNGWDSVVSKYIYKFEFYSDTSPSIKTTIQKLPIIGGRSFDTFTPSVNYLTSIRELSSSDLYASNKLGAYQDVNFTLKQISSVSDDDYSPSVTITSPSSVADNTIPCEGVVYWKSKLGGWMMMGVDIKVETKSHKYNGSLSNGMFESTSYNGGGDIYIPTNYMGTSSELSLNLKTLSLDSDVLKAVSEIAGSPAVYYRRHSRVPSSDDSIELMRMTSSNAPIKTHIGGGDFTIGLTRISSIEYKTK